MIKLTKIEHWLHRIIIVDKLNNAAGFIILLVLSSAIAIIVSFLGINVGLIILAAIIAVPISLIFITNIRFGFILYLFFTVTVFTFNRLVPAIPFGVSLEIIQYLLIIGLLIKKITGEEFKFGVYRNPVSIVLLAWIIYQLFQVMNPNNVNLVGWYIMLRNTFGLLSLYLISSYCFTDSTFLKLFLKAWLTLGLLAAIYGLKQQYLGLFDWESDWLYSSEKRIGLWIMQGNRIRIWSFLGDVSSFGIFMGVTSVLCMVLLIGPFKTSHKVIVSFVMIACLISMVYSGTRTAYITPIAGLSIVLVLNINSYKILLFCGLLGILGLFVLFGPFHNSSLARVRTILNSDKDASLNVREVNKRRIRPYIYSHPMGGGPLTAGAEGRLIAPNHPLAGWPPDSLYMSIALEYGWIGLILFILRHIIVMVYGIMNYFRLSESINKIFLLAILSCYFSITIAQITQENALQYPLGIITVSTYVLVFELNRIDKNEKLQI